MPNNQLQVDEVFDEALRLAPGAERERYLAEVCGDDAEARRRVERLLRAVADAGSFLESPAQDPSPTIDQPITEKPGTQIGPYKLLQQLGEGGMGVVYMAEQKEPVKRRVALKIIKPGMDTRQVIARFEAERQALAMMDHPNIAKVLDAGATKSGRPYFVMELVNGISVTKYCDEQHLTPKERLELFVPICQAVQHAHQKGIIHRDLKPSNILVALYDGRPVPKVIDFGVAKATSQTLTEKTMFTQLGQVVGTLEYMSPEQAERNQLDIDTRSDIYSLGVVLYELLTGDTPFDRRRLRSAAFDEMLRIIREEEPSKPSTKVSSSQSLPSIAANRRIEPGKLGNMIRGELDWIVLKAMEKDRGRRYETASKFAEDVQHYLDDEAVVACPPTRSYRFRKFVRRHRLTLGTGAVVALAVILGLLSTVWQATRAIQQRDRAIIAEENARSAEQEARTEALRAANSETIAIAQRELAHNRLIMSHDLIEQYTKTIAENNDLTRRFPQLQQRLLAEVVPNYTKLIESFAHDENGRGIVQMRLANLLAVCGSHRHAIEVYKSCADWFHQEHASQAPYTKEQATDRDRTELQDFRSFQDEYVAALSQLEEVTATPSGDAEYRRVLGDAEAIVGDWLGRTGQWELAATYFAKAIDRQPDEFDHFKKLAPVLLHLGRINEFQSLAHSMRSRFRDEHEMVRTLTMQNAEHFGNQIRQSIEEQLSENNVTPLRRLALSITQGTLEYRSGNYEEAATQLDALKSRIVGDYNPVRARLFLAMSLARQGQIERAKRELEEADGLMAGYERARASSSHRWYKHLEMIVLRNEVVSVVESAKQREEAVQTR